ncbi:MAG: hypothetical protein HC945_04210 [Nitrosarchaeum sp.]|nr:hypothetical protein [Nitrosarchaeum sp.]
MVGALGTVCRLLFSLFAHPITLAGRSWCSHAEKICFGPAEIRRARIAVPAHDWACAGECVCESVKDPGGSVVLRAQGHHPSAEIDFDVSGCCVLHQYTVQSRCLSVARVVRWSQVLGAQVRCEVFCASYSPQFGIESRVCSLVGFRFQVFRER